MILFDEFKKAPEPTRTEVEIRASVGQRFDVWSPGGWADFGFLQKILDGPNGPHAVFSFGVVAVPLANLGRFRFSGRHLG